MSTQVQIILAVLQLAIKYGIPAVDSVLKTWDKESITLEDVEALKTSLKRPEEYGV